MAFTSFLCWHPEIRLFEKVYSPFLKEERERDKEKRKYLPFSISYLTDVLPVHHAVERKKNLSPLFFYTSHLVTFSHRKYSQHIQMLRVWSQSS